MVPKERVNNDEQNVEALYQRNADSEMVVDQRKEGVARYGIEDFFLLLSSLVCRKKFPTLIDGVNSFCVMIFEEDYANGVLKPNDDSRHCNVQLQDRHRVGEMNANCDFP